MKKGDQVTINVPFTYTIGDEGFNSGNILETIEACKEEVQAEIDNGVLSEGVFMEVAEKDKAREFLEKLHVEWGENWDLVVDFFGKDVTDEWDKIVGYEK